MYAQEDTFDRYMSKKGLYVSLENARPVFSEVREEKVIKSYPLLLTINNIFYNLRMRPTQQDSFRRHNFLAIHYSFVTLNPPKVYIF